MTERDFEGKKEEILGSKDAILPRISLGKRFIGKMRDLVGWERNSIPPQTKKLTVKDFSYMIDKYRSQPELLALVVEMMTPEEREQYIRSLVDNADSEQPK